MEKIDKIKKLPRSILSKIETELEEFKHNHNDLTDEVDGMFRRVRKGVLDDIGNCEREMRGDEGTP